jgi:MFS family permease
MQMLRASPTLRTLSAMTLANTVGSGLLGASVVLYFTHLVGLSGGQVGLGLTVAGGLGLLVGIPVGHVADRRGPREVLVVLMLGEAVATLSYVFVRSFGVFLVAVCLVVTVDRAASAVTQGLLARVLPVEDRVAARAFLRAVTNVGFAIGSGIAGLGILVDTHGAYDALIVGDAVTFAVAALLLLRLPHVPPQPPAHDDGPRLIVLRDRPYLAVSGLVAIMSLHVSLLDVGLPLWVQGHTSAPRAIVAVIFIVNCVTVALFSVRFARGSDTVVGAARAGARAGVLLAASCVVFALTSGLAATLAAVVLVLAAVVQVGGEMAQAASGWGLGFGLAPDHAQGQYQGAASTAVAVAMMAGPATMAAVTSAGTLGWLAYGAVFLAAGFATVPVAAWAATSRERAAAMADATR